MAGVGPKAPRHVPEGKTVIEEKKTTGDAATRAGQGMTARSASRAVIP